jgi:hypothetical protein
MQIPDISTTDLLVGLSSFLFLTLVALAIGLRKKPVSRIRKRWIANIPATYTIEEEGE